MWALVDRDRVGARSLHKSEVNYFIIRVYDLDVQVGDPKPEVLGNGLEVLADLREERKLHLLAPGQNDLLVQDVNRGVVLREVDEDASGTVVVLVEAPRRLDVDGLEVGDDQVLHLELGVHVDRLRCTHCIGCDCACVICVHLLSICVKNESIFKSPSSCVHQHQLHCLPLNRLLYANHIP